MAEAEQGGCHIRSPMIRCEVPGLNVVRE